VPIQASSPEPKKSRWPSLYVQVLLAIALAVALGKLEPRWGIDRFMSEARALTNFVGNAVATIVVSRWENQLDLQRVRAVLGVRSAGTLARTTNVAESEPGASE
jgi:aerobic C4-dicarboxylate transport protein